jgi:hypothetical protein
MTSAEAVAMTTVNRALCCENVMEPVHATEIEFDDEFAYPIEAQTVPDDGDDDSAFAAASAHQPPAPPTPVAAPPVDTASSRSSGAKKSKRQTKYLPSCKVS